MPNKDTSNCVDPAPQVILGSVSAGSPLHTSVAAKDETREDLATTSADCGLRSGSVASQGSMLGFSGRRSQALLLRVLLRRHELHVAAVTGWGLF